MTDDVKLGRRFINDHAKPRYKKRFGAKIDASDFTRRELEQIGRNCRLRYEARLDAFERRLRRIP